MDELQADLCDFIVEIRKENGEQYPPSSMYDLISGLSLYLEREHGFTNKLVSGAFRSVRNTLDNVMKERTAEGISLCQNHNQATRVKPHLRYHGLMFTKKSSIQFILCTFSCHPSQLRIDNYCSCRSLFVYGIAAPKGFQLTVKFESISFLALLIVIQVA